MRVFRTINDEFVHEDNPEAAFLVAGAGCEIPLEFADRVPAEFTTPIDPVDGNAADDGVIDAEKPEGVVVDAVKAEKPAPRRRPKKG